METLEKSKCVRCGKPSKNGGKGGRCGSCLKKLAANKKKPGHWQRAQTKADDALRRQDGKNGTASKKSSGRGNRKAIVKQHQAAEKRTGEKLSPDRKDNSKGYASSNTRSIPEKLNRGRHKADPKKLAAWRKKLKKHDFSDMEMMTMLRKKAAESGDAALVEALEKSIGKKIAGAALAASMTMGAMSSKEAKADTGHLKNYLSSIHGMELDGHKVSVKHSGKEGEKGSGTGKFSISIGDYTMHGKYERAGDAHNKLKLSPMMHNEHGHKPFEGGIDSLVDEKGTAAAEALHEHLNHDGGKTSLWNKLTKPTKGSKMKKTKIEELEEKLADAKEELNKALPAIAASAARGAVMRAAAGAASNKMNKEEDAKKKVKKEDLVKALTDAGFRTSAQNVQNWNEYDQYAEAMLKNMAGYAEDSKGSASDLGKECKLDKDESGVPQMASPDKPEEGRREICEKCGHQDCDCKGKNKLLYPGIAHDKSEVNKEELSKPGMDQGGADAMRDAMGGGSSGDSGGGGLLGSLYDATIGNISDRRSKLSGGSE